MHRVGYNFLIEFFVEVIVNQLTSGINIEGHSGYPSRFNGGGPPKAPLTKNTAPIGYAFEDTYAIVSPTFDPAKGGFDLDKLVGFTKRSKAERGQSYCCRYER